MNAVERLAYSLRKAHANAYREDGLKFHADLIEASYPLPWFPEAQELLNKLQAPQRELIKKWPRDAAEMLAIGVRGKEELDAQREINHG